jgi:hypothetical protein
MNSSILELVISASIGGLITGVFVPTLGEWLKGFFNGYHATKRRKRDKEITIDFIRDSCYSDDFLTYPTTRTIHDKLFRKKIGYAFELLYELQREERISLTNINGVHGKTESWGYNTPNGKEFYS